MATPRPSKRRRTASPELAAPPAHILVAAAAPAEGAPEKERDGATTNASEGGGELHLDDGEAVEEITEEQLDEMTRIYESIAEDYHDIVAELPLEYHRTFALMRELEDQQQEHTSSLRLTLESYISALVSSASAAPSPAASTSTSDEPAAPKISAAAREKWGELGRHALGAIRAGEDKVGLAVGLYESVDRHIRRLDADLAKYEDSLVIGLREGTLPSHDAPAAGRKSPPGATTSRGAIALGEREAYEVAGDDEGAGPSSSGAVEEGEGLEGEGEKKSSGGGGGGSARKTRKGRQGKTPAEVEKEREWKRRREMQKHERKEKKKEMKREEEQAAKGMPIDPNEPVYCYCRRVSFGEMIACENDDCPREWFHLDCVNLSEAPEGSWYCDDCVRALDIDPKTMKPR
ncbi:hypothetical protein JCM6882_001600 [Rhodosporidiobolus microsporus]